MCTEEVKFVSEFCPYFHETNLLCYKATKMKNDPLACPQKIQITMPTCSHVIKVACG